jgi:hypothetical protein
MSCLNCAAGKYSNTVGASSADSCMSCTAGQYAATAGKSACTACETGFFQASIGKSTCTACPANSLSPSSSTNQSHCVCDAGFTGPDGVACTACGAGLIKPETGSQPCRKPVVTPAPAETKNPETFDPSEVIVTMKLGLPISKDDFKTHMQISFRQAIANAAGVGLTKVRIAKITAVNTRRSRRLLAESIAVDVEVAAADSSAAKSVASNLSPDKINAQLEQAGLPKAEVLEAPSVQSQGQNNTGVIVGAVMGSIVAVALLFAASVYFCRKDDDAELQKGSGSQNVPTRDLEAAKDPADVHDHVNVAGRVF